MYVIDKLFKKKRKKKDHKGNFFEYGHSIESSLSHDALLSEEEQNRLMNYVKKKKLLWINPINHFHLYDDDDDDDDDDFSFIIMFIFTRTKKILFNFYFQFRI